MNKQQEPRLRFKGFTGEWKNKTLGDLGRVEMCRRIFKEQTQPSGEIPFFKIGTFGQEPDAFISSELFEEYRQKYPYPKKGDILISAAGTIGRTVEFSGENAYFQDSNIVWLRFDESQITSTFLNITYQNIKWGLEGSTIKRLYNSDLLSAEITLPSFPEQTHLGNFFRRLDSQIAESRAVLEKSRQLKKAMLAKMFPANGEKIPKIRFKGFEGEWKEKSLSELAEQIKSYPLSRNVETLENTGFKYIHYGDIHRGIADIIYSDKALPNIQAGNFELLKRGDLIIADVSEDYEGVGAACVIDCPLEDKVVSGLHTIAIRPNQTSPLFLYYLLKTQEFKQYGRLIGTGTKVVGITASKFLSFQTHIPTVLEQTAIGLFFRQLDETIALQSAEVEKLNQLKKGLLAAMLV